MGLDLSRPKPQPAVEPFLAWDSARLDEFVAFVRACAGTSVRLSRWHMLEFLSSTGCLETQVTAPHVTALFTLFEEEESTVNGLQLAVAILLCSRSPSLEWRIARCLLLFDWMGMGSLSDTELTMGLQVGLAALKRCLVLAGSGTEAVNLRELARRVVPFGSRTPCSKLAEWASSAEEEALACLQHLKFEEKMVVSTEDSAAVAPVVDEPPEMPPQQAMEDAAAQMEATDEAAVEGMDSVQTAEALEGIPSQVPEEQPSSTAADIDADGSLQNDPGNTLADLASMPAVEEGYSDPVPGLLAEMEELGKLAWKGFLPDGARQMTDLAALVKATAPADVEGAGRRASEAMGGDLESLSRRWRKSMGFLQPLAHAGAKSALISIDTSNLSLRNRVWLRQALVCEEMKADVHRCFLEQIGASWAMDFVSAKVVAKARLEAASQLRALVLELSGIGERGATAAFHSLRRATLVCGQRLTVVASEVSQHAAKSLPLRQQWEGEVLRLEGAKQYLDLLPHQTVPAVPCKQQRWAAEQLQQDLQRRLTAMEEDVGKADEAAVQELLTCSVLYRNLTTASGDPGEEIGPELLRTRVRQLHQDSLELMWSAAAVDQSILRESYHFQQHRLLCCEGAVAAQRALVRGTDLRSELWLLQARRSVARVSYHKVVGLLRGNQDVAGTSSSSGSRPQCPRKRRKVLETLQLVLPRIQSSGAAVEPQADQSAAAPETGPTDQANNTPAASTLQLSQVLSEVAQKVLQAIVGESTSGEEQQEVATEPGAGEGPAQAPKVTSEEHHQSVDEGAWAHFRELRFAQRAHAAAVLVAQSMEQSGLYVGLADRLTADLEQATEVLAEVSQSPAFKQRSVQKWKRIVDEVLQDLAASTASIKEAQIEVVHRLAQVEVSLLLEASGNDAPPAIPMASCKGLLLSCASLAEVDAAMSAPPQEVQDLDGWCPVRGHLGQVAVARHRQLAENVGVLWALELGRAEAGTSTVSDSAFMVVKRCVQERVEAQILQVLAEEQMVEVQKTQTEDAIASTAARSSSVQSNSLRLEAPRKSAVVDSRPTPPLLEALVSDCLVLDLGAILRSWRSEPSLQGKSAVLSSLVSALDKYAGGNSTGQSRPPIGAPEWPPLSAWWRTPAVWIDQIASQPPCPRCLAVVQQLFNLRGSEASANRYAAWLRVWLLARARKTASHAVCSEEGSLSALLLVQVQRSSMRALQLLWRYRLLRQAVQDHQMLRQDALKAASRLLGPADDTCLDALEAKDVDAHISEVLETKDRALEDSLASVLRETLQSFREHGSDKAVMEGVDACKSAISARRQAATEEAAAFNLAGDLSCPGITVSPAASAVLSLHSTQGLAAGGLKEDPAVYPAQLCAVVRGLELLKVAKELQAAS